jgi:cytochrome c553
MRDMTPNQPSRFLFLLVLLPFSAAPAFGEAPNGERIYKAQCARCHGPRGEGSKHAKRRLEGDRAISQLADVIAKTMPESNPGSLSAEEAEAVAKYIHGAFYSRVARERNKPARIELARLTVRQYRNAVADLIGAFRWQRSTFEPGGLKAEYFKGRRFNPRERILERTDPRVAFNFGVESPVPGKIEPHEFSIRWRGSVLAPQTGDYEFVIRTEHAARLWVNDERRPLIDAWVKSGNDTEYKANLFLVAGRSYSLRLEYTKAKQGVDDSKTRKKPPPAVKSSITLLWKAPHSPLEPIAGRYLSPAASPEAYICSTPFPPDDRSYGWERGTTVSKEWDQAETDAALAVAGYVSARLNELAGTRDNAPDRKKKVSEFCRKFATLAFRRPLDAAQTARIDRQLSAGKNLETGVKRVVLVVLKSPRFLFREVDPGSFDVASRLSFGLWDSIPDQKLLSARLETSEQVAEQSERMLRDLRGAAKLRDFLTTWLKVEPGRDIVRDTKKFPGFDEHLLSDLRASLELFLDDVLWSEKSDFRQLFLADEVFLNGRLAKFYGTNLPADAAFQKVKLDPGKRAGVLTHPYLMTAFAYTGESSPIHRGVFLARGVLGVSLRPPPEAVSPLAADLHPKLTTRERVILQTKPATCMTCHGIINPLGFTLEHFDAVGRWRDMEKDKPVDAAGAYGTRDGKVVKVNGARELAAFLANSPEAQEAFVEQLFHHLVQQPVRAYGLDTLQELRRDFVKNDFHMRKLAVKVMTIAALKPRRDKLADSSKKP